MPFIPLEEHQTTEVGNQGTEPLGFAPLEDSEQAAPSVLRNVLLNNPATAIGETVLNLGTMSVALPVAGIAGLATEAARAVSLTSKTGADVVHSVGDALTYQPRGEFGQALTGVVSYPFEKLAEGGRYVGGNTLDATGSPLLATAVDTAVNALPMAVTPGLKAGRRVVERVKSEPQALREAPHEALQAATQERGFIPLESEPVAREVLTPVDQVRTQGLSSASEPGRLPQSGFIALENDFNVVREAIQPPMTDAVSPVLGTRPELLAGQPQAKTARYALIEADQIKPSHNIDLRPNEGYPQALARQDWSRRDVEQRLQDISRDFDPERLTTALDDGEGAPMVSRDGVVEVGNTRAVALQRVYQANGAKAQAYREALAEKAPAMGLDPATISEMKKPVLIRIPDEPANRITKQGASDHGKETTITQPDEGQARPEDAARGIENNQGDGVSQYSPAEQRAGEHSSQTEVGKQGALVDTTLPTEGRANAMIPGATYTGFINDAVPRPGARSAGAVAPGDVPVADRPKPIRREDVLIPFMKALDASMYEGRIKSKGVMGFFRPKLEEVRIRKHADLETSAHELAHLIDSRVPEIRKSWLTEPGWQARQAELRGLSYDNTKIYEGFAEFVRHYMTQPDVALAKAPEFHRWFTEFTQRHSYGPAIEQARKGMTDWFNQDALERARSKIGDHRPLSDALDGRWDAFRQATVDDLHGIYRMERDIGKGKIAPNGPYESARLARASASIADGALRYGAPLKKPDGSFAWTGKGLEEILKPVAESLDDALLYFVGRSSRELQAQGREHLFSIAEVDSMLKLRRPEFEAAFKEYQDWNAGVLDFAEAQGVINPVARQLWQRTQYMPFHRVGQPDGFRGKPGDWSGVKALTGGTENLRDILGNMTANAAMLIDKAVKNEARSKIAALAGEEGGGKFMTKIPAESRIVKLEKQAVIDAVLKSMGIDKNDPAAAMAAKRLTKLLEESPAMLEMVQNNMPPAGGNVVAVLKEGKPVWYEVADPLLLRSLESIDRKAMSTVVKWLGLPKRVGQATITLTPDFMIANLARDTIMGSVMSRAGFKPVMDSFTGMRLRMTNDPIYKEFIANGGGLSSIYLDETLFKAKLEKFYNSHGIDYRTVLDVPEKLMGFVETLGDAFETATRLGEYKRAVDAGQNPRHAAYLGREVSTDFAMRGDSAAAGFMYDTVMFLKPALLSFDRLYRGLAHDQNRGAIAAKSGMLALSSAALYLLNRDDQRYQDLPDWDRDTNWHFFVGDKHFRYPKIWEIGAMASVAERTVQRIMESDPAGLGKDFARIVMQTFGLNMMPQIIAPLYEQGANRNGFTKSPIETPGMENQQPFMRAKSTTSETLKAAGMATRDLPESLQVNPVRAEALLRGYFNTWAMYGLALSDKAFFSDNAPTTRTDRLPVVRRFYSEEPPISTRYESMFYDMLGEAKRLHGTLRELDKIGRPEIADEKELEPMAPEAKPLQRAATNLQSINQEMRKIRRDQNLTPDDKRQRLDALTVERNDLLKRAVLDTTASVKAHAQ